MDYGSFISENFEIITICVRRPGHKVMLISTVYKPPKGKIDKCIDFLRDMVLKEENKSKEIWILCDFNVDLLKRDCPNTIKINSFVKKAGLRHLINEITRPNNRGGSCLDYIITNSYYISEAGVLHDLIADHYTVYCIRKKAGEKQDKIFKNVRDYSKFDQKNFEALVARSNWELFDQLLDPNVQWDILLDNVQKIMAIMCPIKKVYARKNITPWLTREIYSLIMERSVMIKRYKISGNQNDFVEIKKDS